MMTWTITRVASEADLEGVLAVERASFTNPWTREMYLADLARQDIAHLYVGRSADGRIGGFCGFWIILDELHLNNLAVLPEARGGGLGSQLLAHALAEGVRLGARRATLEVRRSNQSALRLYQRFAFEVAGIRRRYYSNPEEDALILWREALDAPREIPPGHP